MYFYKVHVSKFKWVSKEVNDRTDNLYCESLEVTRSLIPLYQPLHCFYLMQERRLKPGENEVVHSYFWSTPPCLDSVLARPKWKGIVPPAFPFAENHMLFPLYTIVSLVSDSIEHYFVEMWWDTHDIHIKGLEKRFHFLMQISTPWYFNRSTLIGFQVKHSFTWWNITCSVIDNYCLS